MPIYEYQCPSCKKSYELQQGFSAETTHACEVCGKGIAKRVLHAPTVVFKGSGFYATDNKPGRVAKDDSSSTSGDSAKTESKAPTSESESKKSSGKPDSGSAAEAAV